MRHLKIIFICIIIFLLYLLIDYYNNKNIDIKDNMKIIFISKNISSNNSKNISSNNKNEKLKIKKSVSFADEKNKPLETFIKINK